MWLWVSWQGVDFWWLVLAVIYLETWVHLWQIFLVGSLEVKNSSWTWTVPFWWQRACENLEEGSSVCAHSRWEVCLSRSRVLPPIVRQPTSSGFQCRLKARQCCRTSLDSRTRLGLLRHQSPGLNNFHILGLLVRRAIIGYSYHSLYVSQANECPLNILI